MKVLNHKNKSVRLIIAFALALTMSITSLPVLRADAATKTKYATAKFYIGETDISITTSNLSRNLSRYYNYIGSGYVKNPKNLSGNTVSKYLYSIPSTGNYLNENQYVEWNRMIYYLGRWYVLGTIRTNEPIVTPEPTIEPTPEPTIEPTPEPTPEPTIEPTIEPTPEPTTAPANKFIYTKGTKYYDENNKEFVIKGMNFGNYMWYNPSTPQTWYADENSYKELSEAGINTIRYYLNYALLEDDNNPYVYKQTGLDWLDKNVEWAAKYGIKILFNMHIPQGAIEADSWDVHTGSLHLFTGDYAAANRDRVKAMWKFLANRYKDNSNVIGYGLLNEPRVPYTGDIETSKKIWEDFAEELVTVVRSVDKNHILFIEPTTQIIDMSTMECVIFDYSQAFFEVDDDNYAVEYHFYYPLEFTHMQYNTSFAVGSTFYPNYSEVEACNSCWVDAIWYDYSYNYNNGGWQYVESPLYKVNDLDSINAAYVALRASNMGNGVTAYFDNMVVTAYDENGNYAGTIKNYDCNDYENYKVLPSIYDGCPGKLEYKATGGIDNTGCIALSDTTGEYSITCSNTYKHFALQKGYSYKVSGYVKVDGKTASTAITPTISFVKAENVVPINKDYLKDKVEMFTKYMDTHNVPMYMGEYGLLMGAYGYGGNQWASDMLDIINEKGISASFHEYKPGLYSDYFNGTRNDELYEIFKSKYTK